MTSGREVRFPESIGGSSPMSALYRNSALKSIVGPPVSLSIQTDQVISLSCGTYPAPNPFFLL